jgi:hypothetical protein
LYVILLNDPGKLPGEFQLFIPEEFSKKPVLLGSSAKLKTKANAANGTVKVSLSKKEAMHFATSPALVFRFDKK